MTDKVLTWVKPMISDSDNVLDIPSLSSLSDKDYRKLVIGDLVYVDHGGVLRVTVTGHPIATNIEQLEILLSELEEVKHRMAHRQDGT